MSNDDYLKEVIASQTSLLAYARKLSGDQTEAEDLVQDTLIKAIKSKDQFEPGSNLKAWLFTILRNTFLSSKRRKKEASWDEKLNNSISFSVTPSSAGDSEELHKCLQYIACLPIEQSDALIAVGYLGMSYEEAAATFGVALGTIKSRANRARLALLDLGENTQVTKLSLSELRTATKHVPTNHPYYLIAKAYEDLYASCYEVGAASTEDQKTSAPDKLLEDLISSRVADNNADDMPGFLLEYDS